MGGGGADDVAVEFDGPLAAKFLPLADFAGELLLEGGDGVGRGHGEQNYGISKLTKLTK